MSLQSTLHGNGQRNKDIDPVDIPTAMLVRKRFCLSWDTNLTHIVLLSRRSRLCHHCFVDAAFNWIFYLANNDPETVYLDHPNNHGLDYPRIGDESVLQHFSVQATQIFLAPIFWLARKMSTSSTSASNSDCIFCYFCTCRYLVWVDSNLRAMEFADESQGEAHCGDPSFSWDCVSQHLTKITSPAN